MRKLFKTSRWLRQTERLLFASGLLCLGYSLIVAAHAGVAKHKGEAFGLESATNSEQAQAGGPVDPASKVQSTGHATVVGRLEIPALKLSVPILASDDSSSLMKGVGHIPGTAMPGGLGNVGLAGHRDMYLRPLRGIAPKMDIRVVDQSGLYHYQVDSTEIVTPDQVRVLDINSRPELTLVTCYPFYYVGNAPKRFIVHAHLLSALPDAVE